MTNAEFCALIAPDVDRDLIAECRRIRPAVEACEPILEECKRVREVQDSLRPRIATRANL